MSETWVVRDQFMADMFCKFVQETIKAEKVYCYSIKKETRTSRQNRAMYAVFTRLATALNESGHMLKHPFADDLEVPWCKESIKSILFDPIMRNLKDEDGNPIVSSTQMTGSQLSDTIGGLLMGIDMQLGVIVAGLEGQLDGY